jgi:ABC-type phosphate transport system substrate-binding protein
MRPSRTLAGAILLLTLACLPAAAKDLAVVVHKNNATRNVALADLTKICKATTQKWPDGKDVVLVLRDPASPEMRMVLQKVYGMSADEVKSLISGVNQARKDRILVVGSDDAVIKAVQTIPGAVGIVDVYSITSTVNVVKVDGKMPLEPGYALHGLQ